MTFKRLLLLCGVITLLGAMFFACAAPTQTPATAPATVAHEAEQEHAVEHDAESPALAPVSRSEGEKVRVVATTSIVADVVSNVGGDNIELIELLPRGTDPHSYQPTPRDLRTVADTQVVFANGAGLEEFLDEMLENAGGDAPVIPVSQGIEFLEFEGADEHAGEMQAPEGEAAEEEEHAGEEHHHEGIDPHVWFDPNNVIVWVHNIEHALSELDPANAEAYTVNAQAYIGKLKELDAWIREQVAQIPKENRELVTDHRMLAYFADEYGFEQIGTVIPGYSTLAEPSAQQLADLEEAIQDYNVPAVFVGTTVNPKISERVAEDTGTRLVRFYTGSLSEEGGPADTYLEYMRYNVTQFASALE